MKPPFGEYVDFFSNHKKTSKSTKGREMSHGFLKGWFGGNILLWPKAWTHFAVPIESMGLVDLPTWMVDFVW